MKRKENPIIKDHDQYVAHTKNGGDGFVRGFIDYPFARGVERLTKVADVFRNSKENFTKGEGKHSVSAEGAKMLTDLEGIIEDFGGITPYSDGSMGSKAGSWFARDLTYKTCGVLKEDPDSLKIDINTHAWKGKYA